jgi:hypothetical protein
MKSNRLLDDVNLSEFFFRNNSGGVEFEFLNMRDGAKIAELLCTGIVIFAYHADAESCLPHYVGEVNHALVPPDEEAELLRRLGYRYKSPRGLRTPEAVQLHYIYMEGDGLIELVCTEVQFLEEDVARGFIQN